MIAGDFFQWGGNPSLVLDFLSNRKLVPFSSYESKAICALRALAIGFCLLPVPAMATSDAANTPSEKRLLEEFANAASLGKACGYREEAIGQYYSKEFARLIRKEAKGPTADQDVDREVGIALVSAKMYANQRTEGRRFTSEQCAMARKAIDESVPRGYDKP